MTLRGGDVTIAAHAPEQAQTGTLFSVNTGLLALHLFSADLFFASCVFDETRYSWPSARGCPA